MEIDLMVVLVRIFVTIVILMGGFLYRKYRLNFWIVKAVWAYEQIVQGPMMGPLRKDYVMDFIAKKFKIVTKEELEILLQAAVAQMNSILKPKT